MTARRTEVAAIVLGVAWLAIAMFVGVTIRYQVPNPAELLADVADRPVPWMASNVLLILLPLPFALAGPGFVGLAGKGSVGGDLIGPLAALGGGALAFSGIAHGVFGAHLAARYHDGDPLSDLARLAEVVHALGDTGWFVGVGALMAITALATWGGRRRLPGWVVAAGAGSVLANALQFAWFADHVFGVFAGPGTALQSVWLVAAVRGGDQPHRSVAGVPEGTPAAHPDSPHHRSHGPPT